MPLFFTDPSTFVVFEGLDATGKTTQLERLKQLQSGEFYDESLGRAAPLFDQDVLFTHQPSGGGALGEQIYKLTEEYEIASPWTRQFLHLASHSEHYQTLLLPHLRKPAPVIMDRFWWSTVAYGFFGGGLHERMGFNHFMQLASAPAWGVYPDIIFMFLEPWTEDRHNTVGVIDGYNFLAETAECVLVPKLTVEDTTRFILETLARRGLLDGWTPGT
jgi:dTMP kinase